jgi:protein TonB
VAVALATPIDLVPDVGIPDHAPLPAASEPGVDPLPLPRPWDAPPGDRDNDVPVTMAPANADGRVRAAPAPDQGRSGGAPPDHAFRRDRTMLRSRLSDGADQAQPARTRTSARQASPQAIRREPKVGVGDSVRTAPRREPAPGRAAVDLALGGEPAGAQQQASAASEASPSTQGPIDAERGARAFDTEQPGKANDNDTLRAASNELHPGLTDFSRPAAPSDARSPEGRGPGAEPGAVARPAAGTAAAALGAPNPKLTAQEVAERTLERRYDRYKLEIRQRVNGVLEWPKALALRLEQGETIVYFKVSAEGRLSEGPWVTKSSGFQEFDSAAVRAVRRAAPFPPMPDAANARPLPVSMPVTFDNPVVR